MARRITREEGILAGESCGTAMVAARDARPRPDRPTDGGRDAVVVVILPDGGRNYLSKLYNDEWMRANGLLATPAAVVRIGELLAERPPRRGRMPDLVLARTTERVGDAIETLQALRHQPAARVASARRRRAWPGSWARSRRRASSTGRIATRRSSSGPSAR